MVGYENLALSICLAMPAFQYVSEYLTSIIQTPSSNRNVSPE
jgi:hypothetical protein